MLVRVFIIKKINKNIDKNISGDVFINYQCKYKLVKLR